MSKKFIVLGLVIFLVAGTIQVAPAPAQQAADYWPTEGWRTSTPEEQGMDSERLAAMLVYVAEHDINLHSILITRNGYLVTEVYFPGNSVDYQHRIYSCTKSVISAAVGIAIDQGFIADVDQPILGFFPDGDFDNLDDAKAAMTLADFLTMTSGLDWPDETMTLTIQMASQQDWVDFVLDRPMAAEPGTEFVYNNGVPHVLSAIVQGATGMPTAEFVQQHLFDPLGIDSDDYRWESDPQGISNGGWGLWMRPRDMAKLGYLYLQAGVWDGVQIIPAEWVADSTRTHITTRDAGFGYGYLWWTLPNLGIYAARGLEGQLIYVVPDQQLVVVFTAKLRGSEGAYPERWVLEHIIPAAESSAPLPANPDGVAQLDAAVAALTDPEQ